MLLTSGSKLQWASQINASERHSCLLALLRLSGPISQRIMHLFQLSPFLKNIQLIGHAGDHVVLDWKRKSDAEYDSLNFRNFLNCQIKCENRHIFSKCLWGATIVFIWVRDTLCHRIYRGELASLSVLWPVCEQQSYVSVLMPMRDSLRAHPYTNNDYLYKELSS